MVDDIFISGLDLHEKVGMPVVMIEDILRRGCPCYNIENSTPVPSISETFFFNEPKRRQWGAPHESYESEKLLYRLSMVKLPVRDVIQHCKAAYGDIESKKYVDRLNARNNEHIHDPTDKPLDRRKENTYVRVIAALLCLNGVPKPLKGSALPGKIERQTERLGVRVSEDAARTALKEAFEIIDIKPH
ncbi:hypothetical protein [Fundidesulfovibrio terrae]|uniref:hypothetical protein n=1 Tax=Fundidesulfovibrio terrae TaxID=2922866 RepID=UPI001FAFA780|nr:hypothetical protein [Fundidesulfovibrio terrae]